MIRRRPETDDEEEDNVSFLRQFCICEEDRISRTGEMRTGLNGPRWFRSENVIPIERARAQSRTQPGLMVSFAPCPTIAPGTARNATRSTGRSGRARGSVSERCRQRAHRSRLSVTPAAAPIPAIVPSGTFGCSLAVATSRLESSRGKDGSDCRPWMARITANMPR